MLRKYYFVSSQSLGFPFVIVKRKSVKSLVNLISLKSELLNDLNKSCSWIKHSLKVWSYFKIVQRLSNFYFKSKETINGNSYGFNMESSIWTYHSAASNSLNLCPRNRWINIIWDRFTMVQEMVGLRDITSRRGIIVLQVWFKLGKWPFFQIEYDFFIGMWLGRCLWHFANNAIHFTVKSIFATSEIICITVSCRKTTEKCDHQIYKAMPFTTAQQMKQVAGNILPENLRQSLSPSRMMFEPPSMDY